jgi:hypothetical protein
VLICDATSTTCPIGRLVVYASMMISSNDDVDLDKEIILFKEFFYENILSEFIGVKI